MKKMLRVIVLLLAVVWCGLIWSFSMANGAESAETSGDVLEFINGILSRMGFETLFTHQTVRKIAHFAEFFALGLLASLAFYAFDFPHFVFCSLPAVFLVACVDELIQRFSQGRTASPLDVLLDLAGGTCGIALFYLLLCLGMALRRRKMKKL